MNLKNLIDRFRGKLDGVFPKSEIDGFVRIICESILGYSTVDMVLRQDIDQPDFITVKFDDIAARLSSHEPIQYILGDAYFYGHHFKVDRATLIPRPETEELVDIIVKQNGDSDLRVLDIGTGSGCIAISLAIAMNFPSVSAFDISEDALTVARENAAMLKAKVSFDNVDILNAKPVKDSFDIIVSNPPYICEKEKVSMDKNVLEYEPGSALFVPDDNPLLFYRAIASYAIVALHTTGTLYFEINSLYSAQVCDMLAKEGYSDVTAVKDFCSRPRFISAKKNDR